MLNIAVLVSGGGTNLQAMLDAKARGEIPNGRFACVVASNPKAYALERAKNAGVETEVLVRRSFPPRTLMTTPCWVFWKGTI